MQRSLSKKILITLGWKSSDPYAEWVNEQKDKIQFHRHLAIKNHPLVSIVVPAFNTPQKYLDPFVRSVVAQTYDNWELVIVDASSEESAKERIEESIKVDSRIRIVTTENKGISSNTNIGITESKGEYIAFMDHDDTIEHNALEEVIRVFTEQPVVSLVYSDEDKLTEDGSRYADPHFKPSWSPHLLTHVNYITHFVVVKKSFIKKAGYLDPDKDGAQDYDFLLRLTDAGAIVKHIPKILYHWRIADNSTAADISNKSYVLQAGERALTDHYARRKIEASASAIKGMPGFYKVTYVPPSQPTIIIMPFANKNLLKKYVNILNMRGLLKNYKVIVPSLIRSKSKFITIDEHKPVDYLKEAIKHSGERIVLLNDFVFPDNGHTWANDIAGVLNDDRVHTVAPAILKKDNTIIDLGIAYQGKEKILLFYGLNFGSSTPFGNTSWPRNVDELMGCIIATRKSDLASFLKAKAPTKDTLGIYSSSHVKDKFNVVWTSVAMIHAKVPATLSRPEPSYYNPNIHDHVNMLHLYADDQQIMDALIALENEVL